MPRYYFHLYNSIETRDDQGRSLADDDAARDVAIQEARQMMGESMVQKGEIDLSHWIEVGNAMEEPLMVVMFRDAVLIRS